jgi:hypothetical protein
MPQWVDALTLWLLVVNLGITFGAGIYEARINVPQWLRGRRPGEGRRWNREVAAEANVGPRFWAYFSTVPLTILTPVSLIRALMAHPPLKGWWLGASLIALFERLLTFGYFVPTLLRLLRNVIRPQSSATVKAVQWAHLAIVRHAAILLAWLAALKAFATFYRTGG